MGVGEVVTKGKKYVERVEERIRNQDEEMSEGEEYVQEVKETLSRGEEVPEDVLETAEEYAVRDEVEDVMGEHYVQQIRNRLVLKNALPDDALEQAEEYGVRDEVEELVGDYYVKRMREATKYLFWADLKETDLDEGLEREKETMESLGYMDIDADSTVPEEYEEAKDRYTWAKNTFRYTQRVKSFMDEHDIDLTYRQKYRLGKPVSRPPYEIKKEHATGGEKVLKKWYVRFRKLNDLAKGALFRSPYGEDLTENRDTAEQKEHEWEDRIETARKELEAAHKKGREQREEDREK